MRVEVICKCFLWATCSTERYNFQEYLLYLYTGILLVFQFDIEKFNDIYTDLKWFEGKKLERMELDPADRPPEANKKVSTNK